MPLTSHQRAARAWESRLSLAEHHLEVARELQARVVSLLAHVYTLTGVRLTYRDDLDDVDADEIERRAGEVSGDRGRDDRGKMGRTI
jgi:hypothetical protein